MAKRKKGIKKEVNISEKKLVPQSALGNIILTPKQKQLIKTIEDNDIIVITGPAGTAKTFLSCYYAVKSIKNNEFKKIIFTKPIQESGERLGFLPGTIDEKIDPYYESFRVNLLKMVTKATYEKLVKQEIFENRPLAYMRGATFDDCLMVGDEFQNTTLKQLILYITRMGRNSKIIIGGDIRQHDINKRHVALPFLVKSILNDIPKIGLFDFTDDDIMRNKILIKITKKYEEMKYNNNIPKEYL